MIFTNYLIHNQVYAENKTNYACWKNSLKKLKKNKSNDQMWPLVLLYAFSRVFEIN